MSQPITSIPPEAPAPEAPQPASLPTSVLAELRQWRMKASLRFVAKSLRSVRGRDR